MSDVWDKPAAQKFKDGLSLTSSVSPHTKHDTRSRIALSVCVKNNFMKELYDSHKLTGFSYVDILNTQIDSFQFIHAERLEKRLSTLAYKVQKDLKNTYRNGRKRHTYLSDKTDIAIFENELCNVKQLNCTLNHFSKEQIELEQRCYDLVRDIEQLQNENFELSFDNSNIIISENSLKTENDALRHQNDKLVNDIDQQLLEISSISKEIQVNEKKIGHLEKEKSNAIVITDKELKDYISKLEKTYQVDVRKKHDDLAQSSRARRLRTFATEAEKALWISESFGLTPKSLKCKSRDGKDLTINFANKQSYGTLTAEEKQNLRELIYILDRFNISDAAYHELSMADTSLPRKSFIIQERSNLSNIYHIERTPGKTPGAYVSIKDEIIRYIQTNHIDNGTPIKIKLAGDGAKVSRISNFLTFTLSILNQNNCISVNNIKTIAIIKCNETYENMKICCNAIFSEFNDLIQTPEISVDEKTYPLDIFFNGDMKFIQICMGLNGSTANFACPWCTVSKEERCDISKDADHYESDQLRRTLKRMTSDSATNKFGSKHEPLIQIEPNRIVPDELHLLMRISDVLLQNLIDDCRQLDDEARILNRKADHLDRLVKAINECGVSFHTWIDKSGMAQNSSLTGCGYKKLLSSLPDKLLFIINNSTYDETVFLWRELNVIHESLLQANVTKTQLFDRVKQWMETFILIGKKGRVGYHRITPYMHSLIYHIPGFVERFGGLANFSGQGVEKMNDQIKSIHQRRSNKIDQTVDDLQTRKRMEHLIDLGCERKRNKYTKKKESYWEKSIHEKHVNKRQRITFEMECVDNVYQQKQKDCEKALEEMSVSELKQKVKSLGLPATKLRRKDKLIDLIRKNSM